MLVNSTPVPLHFQERTLPPTVQVTERAPGQIWTGEEKQELFTSTTLEPLFFQPVASRYADHAIPPPSAVLTV